MFTSVSVGKVICIVFTYQYADCEKQTAAGELTCFLNTSVV